MSDTRAAVREAAMHVSIKKSRVLVVGANTGESECRQFIEAGAPEVHGLDVLDNTGVNFPHSRVTYHRMSIENADLPSDSYDLVFCFATMEHVPNVAAAFSEMVRLTRPGGTVYSMAAPLWHSALGHHMDMFSNDPWIHLAKSRDEIIDHAKRSGFGSDEKIKSTVSYMFDDRYFNKRPTTDYISACAAIRGIRAIKNAIDIDRRSLDHPNAEEAMLRGISATDLLGLSHRFVAHKDGGGFSLRRKAVSAAYYGRNLVKAQKRDRAVHR